jgi:hypothetical protein
MAAARAAEIVERLRAGELLVFDGGYGTALFDAGLENGDCPEPGTTRTPTWSAGSTRATRRGPRIPSKPIPRGHRACRTSTTSAWGTTWGARTRELNEKGVRLARAVCPPGGFVAGSHRSHQLPAADYGVSARTWRPTRSTSRLSMNKPRPLPRRGGLLRGGDHDVPAGGGSGDPGLQGGRGPAGHGHHVLPVRGAARPRPTMWGESPADGPSSSPRGPTSWG